jgi:Arc/MetJ-type ribon-helix-helix transcriptional regulator
MSTTERLALDLPSDLVAKLREHVDADGFASESELMTLILQAWYGSDGLSKDELEEVRAAVAEGLADVQAGHVYDADEVHAELRARIKTAAAHGE